VTRYLTALLAVLCCVPSLARAQQDLGLDLTTDEKKEEKEKKPEKKTPPPTTTPTTGTATGGGGEAKKPEVNEEQAEREVILEDRVKAVQKKVYLKKGRFELSPMVGLSVNDPYYSKYALTGLVAYYLADTVAVAGRFSYLSVVATDDVRTAKHAFQSRIFVSIPKWIATGDVLWSPIYGKVTIFNTILHFDAYLLGGMGTVYTETSVLPNRGPNIAFDLGVGAKFVAKDYLAVNAALINTSYVDIPTGTTEAITQNVMTLNVGVSLFVPFKSTGRESE
jgi:outer membrane beta-barrel protein